MSSWNDQNIVNNYSDANDDPAQSWYEDEVNIPSIVRLLPAGGGKLLDFGCGPGNFTNRLSKDFEAIGSDSASNMIEKARGKFADIPFFVWDGLSPSPDQSGPFDAIVTKLALEFIEDLQGVSKNLYDALETGGTLVVSVQHPLLAITMHPEKTISYWGMPKFEVQIGTTGTQVIKIQRNLGDYVAPFIAAGFTLAAIDEPQIPMDIAEKHAAREIDRTFPKRLNLQFSKD